MLLLSHIHISFQAARDFFPVVHITMEDAEIHHMEELQVVLHWRSIDPAAASTDIPLHLFIPGKYCV